MKHTCKAPNCPAQIPTALLMCPRHWAQVPRTIQLRVTASWRALCCARPSQDAYAKWRTAADEAIASLTKKNPVPSVSVPSVSVASAASTSVPSA